VTRLLHNDFQTASTAPFFSLVNQFGQPSKWRGRAGLSWAHAGFLASATVSYVSSYVNALQVPAQSVGAWTTTDLFFSYKTGAEQAPLIRDLTLTLGINNVMDREPPHVEVPVAIPGQNPIPFDPANASPLGRFVTFGVTKHW
jgi:outer membrane receptor protein involved in Fe transport